MRVRHKWAKGMLVRAERTERTMADFVGEGEIARGRCLADMCVGFGMISAQDTRRV